MSFFDLTLILSVFCMPFATLMLVGWVSSRPIPARQRRQLSLGVFSLGVSSLAFAVFLHSFLLPETSSVYGIVLADRWTYFTIAAVSFAAGFYANVSAFKSLDNAVEIFPWLARNQG